MAGYSGTPLAQKLGIKEGARVLPINAPKNYNKLLQPIPDGVRFVSGVSATTDLVHLFTTRRAELQKTLTDLRTRIKPDAAVWVSWPKKASRLPTDLTENVLREIGLPLGLVDVKVCAVDEVWSGLKFVRRKENRG